MKKADQQILNLLQQIKDAQGGGGGEGLNEAQVNALIQAATGTAPEEIIKLDETGKLPAVDGSQLINLPAGAGVPSILSSSGSTAVVADDVQYLSFVGSGFVWATAESGRQMIIPVAGTLAKFFVVTSVVQPGDGALVLTVRVNGVDTGITITIAAGAAAGTFSDVTNTAAVAAGDLLSFSGLNSSPGTGSATLKHWAIIIE